MTARGRVVMISMVGVVRVSVSMSNVCDVMLPMCDVNYCECEVGWGLESILCEGRWCRLL